MGGDSEPAERRRHTTDAPEAGGSPPDASLHEYSIGPNGAESSGKRRKGSVCQPRNHQGKMLPFYHKRGVLSRAGRGVRATRLN